MHQTGVKSTATPFRYFLWPLVVFLVHYLITGYLNRYATDDFEFLNKLRDYGFTGSVKFFYDTWSVRWASIGLMNAFFSLPDVFNPLLCYSLFILLFLLIAGKRLVEQVFQVKGTEAVVLASYLLMGLFYTCFNIGETFYWINSSVTYLVATACLAVMLSELFLPRIKWYSWLILFVSAAYMGGSYEPMSFVIMSISGIFIFAMFKTHGPMAAARPAVIKTIILLSILMIAFAVSFSGEGHKIRSTFLPDTTILYRAWAFVKAMIKITILFGPWKLLLAMVFCMPFFVLASSGKIKLPVEISILKATGVLIILFALSYFPIVFVMSEMGPERAWMQVTFYICLYAVFISVKLGEKFKNHYFTGPAGLRSFTLTLAVALLGFAAVQLDRDVMYVKAYESRMTYLKALSESGQALPEVVELKPLPEPGLLKSAEISEYPDGAFNHFLTDYFRLNTKVKREIQ
jgi:hypothetical protein